MLDGKAESVTYNRATTEGGVDTTTFVDADVTRTTEHSTPLSDFAAAIREKRQPETCLEKALVVQEITDAIYLSAESGNVVEVGGTR